MTNSRGLILDAAVDDQGRKLGVEVLSDPFECDVVAVLFLNDHFAHQLHFPDVSVVQLHEMKTHERVADQAEVEELSSLCFVDEASFFGVGKMSRPVRYDGTH